jgi:hypothetical protein
MDDKLWDVVKIDFVWKWVGSISPSRFTPGKKDSFLPAGYKSEWTAEPDLKQWRKWNSFLYPEIESRRETYTQSSYTGVTFYILKPTRDEKNRFILKIGNVAYEVTSTDAD